MDCAISTIRNRTSGFDFGQLYKVNLYLNQTCPPSSDVFFPGTTLLTEPVCRKISGTSNAIWSGWTKYPTSDVWNRIVSWKLGLIQLVSQLPRPPLGPGVEIGVLAHLTGDPIDCFTNMLLTLAMCSVRANQAKRVCLESGMDPSSSEYNRTWKSLAIIMVSYDECGLTEKADSIWREYQRLRAHIDFEDELQHIYDETAFSLAADRQTKTLPVAIAEVFFVAGWILSLSKAAASEPSPTNWVNVEAHSIAFSALYLWVSSAVGIGSVIGASQTESSIPRLLQAFEYNMTPFRGYSAPDYHARRPSAASREKWGWCKMSTDRAIHGGVYCWRPQKWRSIPEQFGIDTSILIVYSVIAIAVVGSCFFTAAILSYLVAPRGPSCRHIPESIMFVLWLLSFVIGSLLERWLRKAVFWTVLWKDMFFAVANIAIILITQFGILNRCSCWSMGGSTGLNLPQWLGAKTELMELIREKAPWIVSMAILFQLLFCTAVGWKYWDAFRVFIQRDDGVSNLSWETRRVGTELRDYSTLPPQNRHFDTEEV